MRSGPYEENEADPNSKLVTYTYAIFTIRPNKVQVCFVLPLKQAGWIGIYIHVFS